MSSSSRVPRTVLPTAEASQRFRKLDRPLDLKAIVHSPPSPRSGAHPKRYPSGIAISRNESQEDAQSTKATSEPTLATAKEIEEAKAAEPGLIDLEQGPVYAKMKSKVCDALLWPEGEVPLLDPELIPRLEALPKEELVEENVKKSKEIAALRNFLAVYMVDIEQAKVELLRENRALHSELGTEKSMSHRKGRYVTQADDALAETKNTTVKLKEEKAVSDGEKRTLERVAQASSNELAAIQSINRELTEETNEVLHDTQARLINAEKRAHHFREAHVSSERQIERLLKIQKDDQKVFYNTMMDLEDCFAKLEPALEDIRHEMMAKQKTRAMRRPNTEILSHRPLSVDPLETQSMRLVQELGEAWPPSQSDSRSDSAAPSFSDTQRSPSGVGVLQCVGIESIPEGSPEPNNSLRTLEAQRKGSIRPDLSRPIVPLHARLQMSVTSLEQISPRNHSMSIPIADADRVPLSTVEKTTSTDNLETTSPLKVVTDSVGAGTISTSSEKSIPSRKSLSILEGKPSTPLQIFSNNRNLKLEDRTTAVSGSDEAQTLSPAAYTSIVPVPGHEFLRDLSGHPSKDLTHDERLDPVPHTLPHNVIAFVPVPPPLDLASSPKLDGSASETPGCEAWSNGFDATKSSTTNKKREIARELFEPPLKEYGLSIVRTPSLKEFSSIKYIQGSPDRVYSDFVEESIISGSSGSRGSSKASSIGTRRAQPSSNAGSGNRIGLRHSAESDQQGILPESTTKIGDDVVTFDSTSGLDHSQRRAATMMRGDPRRAVSAPRSWNPNQLHIALTQSPVLPPPSWSDPTCDRPARSTATHTKAVQPLPVATLTGWRPKRVSFLEDRQQEAAPTASRFTPSPPAQLPVNNPWEPCCCSALDPTGLLIQSSEPNPQVPAHSDDDDDEEEAEHVAPIACRLGFRAVQPLTPDSPEKFTFGEPLNPQIEAKAVALKAAHDAQSLASGRQERLRDDLGPFDRVQAAHMSLWDAIDHEKGVQLTSSGAPGSLDSPIEFGRSLHNSESSDDDNLETSKDEELSEVDEPHTTNSRSTRQTCDQRSVKSEPSATMTADRPTAPDVDTGDARAAIPTGSSFPITATTTKAEPIEISNQFFSDEAIHQEVSSASSHPLQLQPLSRSVFANLSEPVLTAKQLEKRHENMQFKEDIPYRPISLKHVKTRFVKVPTKEEAVLPRSVREEAARIDQRANCEPGEVINDDPNKLHRFTMSLEDELKLRRSLVEKPLVLTDDPDEELKHHRKHVSNIVRASSEDQNDRNEVEREVFDEMSDSTENVQSKATTPPRPRFVIKAPPEPLSLRHEDAMSERRKQHEHAKTEAALVSRTPPLTPASIRSSLSLTSPAISRHSAASTPAEVSRLSMMIQGALQEAMQGTFHNWKPDSAMQARTGDVSPVLSSPSQQVLPLQITRRFEEIIESLNDQAGFFGLSNGSSRAVSLSQISPGIYGQFAARRGFREHRVALRPEDLSWGVQGSLPNPVQALLRLESSNRIRSRSCHAIGRASPIEVVTTLDPEKWKGIWHRELRILPRTKTMYIPDWMDTVRMTPTSDSRSVPSSFGNLDLNSEITPGSSLSQVKEISGRENRRTEKLLEAYSSLGFSSVPDLMTSPEADEWAKLHGLPITEQIWPFNRWKKQAFHNDFATMDVSSFDGDKGLFHAYKEGKPGHVKSRTANVDLRNHPRKHKGTQTSPIENEFVRGQRVPASRGSTAPHSGRDIPVRHLHEDEETDFAEIELEPLSPGGVPGSSMEHELRQVGEMTVGPAGSYNIDDGGHALQTFGEFTPRSNSLGLILHPQTGNSCERQLSQGAMQLTSEIATQMDPQQRRFPSLDAGRSMREAGVQIDRPERLPVVPVELKPSRRAVAMTSVQTQTRPPAYSPLDKPTPSPFDKPLPPQPSSSFSIIESMVYITECVLGSHAKTSGITLGQIWRTIYWSFLFMVLYTTWLEQMEWRDANVGAKKYNQVVSWRSEALGWDPWEWIRYHATMYFEWNRDLMV